MTPSPMKVSAITFGGRPIYNLDIRAYKALKDKREHENFMRRFKKLVTLWTPFAAISMSVALLPVHFV